MSDPQPVIQDAVPDPDTANAPLAPEHRTGTGAPLAAIPGMVPQPRDFPAGCRFHPRCPFAREPRCTAEPPDLRPLGPGHLVRCHYAGELGPPREGSSP